MLRSLLILKKSVGNITQTYLTLSRNMSSSSQILEKLKEVACDAIDRDADSLHTLSDNIHKHPELGFEEYYAHETLTTYLKEKGLVVKPKHGIETAFYADYEPKPASSLPNIGLICEYDALPNIGHACGHNLIAEVGVAAAVGVKAALDSTDQTLGKVCNTEIVE